MDTIRVMLVDDHALLRQGLRRILELEQDIEIVGETGDGSQVLDLVAQARPDVILMDINMPGLSGLEATRRIKQKYADVEIIALTVHDDDQYVFEVIKAGAKGYLLKDVEPARIAEAIRSVKRGDSCLSPNLIGRVLTEFRRLSQETAAAWVADLPSQGASCPLTQRELEILQLIVNGCANKEIADALYISEKTVKNHVSNILRKLDVADRTQAAVYALRAGMVTIEPH